MITFAAEIKRTTIFSSPDRPGTPFSSPPYRRGTPLFCSPRYEGGVGGALPFNNATTIPCRPKNERSQPHP